VSKGIDEEGEGVRRLTCGLSGLWLISSKFLQFLRIFFGIPAEILAKSLEILQSLDVVGMIFVNLTKTRRRRGGGGLLRGVRCHGSAVTFW
jgi:hypothetical protein